MNWKRWRWTYWTDLFRRRKLARDLDDELNAHVQFEIQRRIGEGQSPDEARRAALRDVRSLDSVKEATRDAWTWTSIERLMQDLRYAARTLLKTPVFTGIAILSLALGIGANTAIFSLVNALLLRTLPVSHPEELVLLTSYSREYRVGDFAYPDYLRLRDQTQVFSGLLGAGSGNRMEVDLGNRTDRPQIQIVTGNYFTVLGVQPLQGRLLVADDDNAPVAVISHGFWQRSFGGDPSAVGKSLMIHGSLCAIVGVAPPEFHGDSAGEATDVWMSLGMQQAVTFSRFDMRKVRYVTWANMIGRLKPGMTIEQARAEVAPLVAQIHESAGTSPDKDYLHHIVMEPGGRGFAEMRERLQAPLIILMTVVALVLLMACTNLASLLLARAASRQREIATRLAIGASRMRVIRQLLTESVLLALIGGAFGLLLAMWINRFLLNLVSQGFVTITINLSPDGRILLFTSAVSVLTGILFGLTPAIQAVRRDAGPALKTTSRTIAGRTRRGWLRNVLIFAQVALSLVLLTAGALFVRTVRNLKTVDTGFAAGNVLSVGIAPHRTAGPAQEADLAARLIDRLSAIPGIRSATVAVNATLGLAGSGVYGLEIEGYTPKNEDDQRARANWVGPRYFETLGMSVLQGREFSMADTLNSSGVVIVNQTMARHYFGEESAIGKRIRFNKRDHEIVGVVRDAKYRELREVSPRMVFFAFLQYPNGVRNVEVRTDDNPLAFAETVRSAIKQVDPQLDAFEVATVAQRIDRKLTPEYLVADISGFFSGLTLLLVCIGIYGTLSYSVAGRTNEIGVRMALGAKRSSVLLLILRDILWTLIAGLAVGLAGALAAGRVVESLLFGLKPNDPVTLTFVVLLVAAVALLAGYIPARRATRVDPVSALRAE